MDPDEAKRVLASVLCRRRRTQHIRCVRGEDQLSNEIIEDSTAAQAGKMRLTSETEFRLTHFG
jgi:hypothetical protein